MKIEAQPCDTLEICIHPPNVLHEYQCKIENVWFYTNPRYKFPLLNGKDKAVSLYFHILISPHRCLARISGQQRNVGLFTFPRNMSAPPEMFCTNISVKLKMFGFIHIPDICFHPQMFGMNIRIELKMLGLYVSLYVGSL